MLWNSKIPRTPPALSLQTMWPLILKRLVRWTLGCNDRSLHLHSSSIASLLLYFPSFNRMNAASSAPSPHGGPAAASGDDGRGGGGGGKLRYILGFSVGALLFVMSIMFIYYLCTRANVPAQPTRRRSSRPAGEARVADDEAGLDEATLTSYPVVVYSKVKRGRKGSTTAGSCCSICLADYKDADVLRALPECGHLFHLDCVDPWLRSRPTCPLCRTSPMPSPLSTPLAEVVPLSGQSWNV